MSINRQGAATSPQQRVASEHDQTHLFTTVLPEEVRWREIPGGLGAQFATLLGSQDEPGPYVVQVRFPPHTMDTPHSHTADRYVTVLEGNWMIGTGPHFDPESATALPPGSVMFHPAHGVHWDGSAGDTPVVVQIFGMGPVATIPADAEAPRWVRVGTT